MLEPEPAFFWFSDCYSMFSRNAQEEEEEVPDPFSFFHEDRPERPDRTGPTKVSFYFCT